MDGNEMSEDESNENGFSEMDTLEWKKMCRVISGSGFREGALAGRDAAFQNGFDTGYSQGFQNGLVLGYIKGIVRIADNEESKDLSANPELSKTSRASCQLCSPKSKPKEASEMSYQSLSDIIQQQKIFIQNTFHAIQNKNSDFLTNWNISLPNTADQGSK